jgi:alginate O-acetyltransferase complex protein AlgJ
MMLLLAPGVFWISGWKEKTISTENKQPAAKPKLNPALLDPFPAKYEAWYNDHFPARNSLIFGYNYFYARYLQKSPKPELVTIGKSGWLYLANNEMNVYTGKLRFSEDDLKKSLHEIQYRQQQCAEIGVEYRIVIIPSKYTVYPEYLPDDIHKYPGANATDQFVAYMKQDTSLKILDLRPLIIAHKKEGQLYIKGDNHWNGRGAFWGYQEIIRWLLPAYKIQAPLEFSEVAMEDSLQRGGNVKDMIGMSDVWKDVWCKVQPLKPLPPFTHPEMSYPCPAGFPYCFEYETAYQNSDSTLPGLLVIRESFTNALMRDLLAAHFGRTSYIWDKWEHRLNLDIIRKEKPKLVLCMLVESMVDCFVNYPDAPKPDAK